MPDLFWASATELARLIAVDNVFQAGRVINPGDESPNVVAMRRFNDRVAKDSRVECVMVPIRDGHLRSSTF